MVRVRRTGRTRWITAATAALTLTAAASLAIASPAHAETFPIRDTFDDSRLWTVEEIPGTTSADVASFPGAHTGPNMAYLDAYPIGPWEAQQVDLGNAQVNLKVHSGGPTGQIISVIGANHFRVGWILRTFAPIPWPASSRTITVEIAVYHGVAMADDLAVSC